MAVKDLWKTSDGSKVPKEQQTGKRWQADWTEANGKRRRARFATKVEAEAFHAEQVKRVRGGGVVDPAEGRRNLTADVYVSFMDRLRTSGARGRAPASDRTIQKYERIWRDYIEDRWGATPIGLIQHGEVSAWVTSLRSKKDPEVVAGSATRIQVATIFQTLMKHAMRLGWLDHNPALDKAGEADYKPSVRTLKEHSYLTMNQLLMIVDELENASGTHLERNRLMILVAGLCGLRWGELIALTVADLKFGDSARLRVSKAYTDVGGRLVLKSTKTGEDRDVPIPGLLADRLQEFVRGCAADRLLFQSTYGHAVRYSRFMSDVFKPVVSLAQWKVSADPEGLENPEGSKSLEGLTFHDLRHTAVSLAITNGANVKVVQRIAGHKSATLTLDTYAGLFDRDLDDSAVRLNGALERHLENYRHLFVT